MNLNESNSSDLEISLSVGYSSLRTGLESHDREHEPVLGERIRRLRQERRWTQAGLAENLGIDQKQVSAYEREVHSPSTDVLIKLAEAFDVTLDYLAFEAQGQSAQLNIQDRELLHRFEAVDKLSEPEKVVAKQILDLLVLKRCFQELAESGAAR